MAATPQPATPAIPVAGVRRTFTRWAPWYDATHALLPGRKAAVRALQLQAGERVLDLACGTGLALRHLERGVGPGGEVVGLDLTPAMLERARRRAGRHGWGNAKFQEGDAARLPFPAASFDAALCAYALHIIPDYQGAVRELHRVLKPHGRLAVADLGPADGRPERQRGMARMPHVCGVDFGHDVLAALRSTFPDVATMRRLGGAYVALARK